ncbi:MAG: class I SAM-dependent methyltransferase [Chitinophagaceae bacterium]|nr:class I SAM-dependent methyltransferase [Chitinophagaceae bacterium]
MDWWDTNAGAIEKIWAMSFELQKIIRLPYLKEMKKFFTDNSEKASVKILEIGCGTGWVCRMIADENFHVLGTDFSKGQLAIAISEAKIYNKEKYCTYELADASSFPTDIDGVVIHALLHHLSSQELVFFFEKLKKIPKTTKVFIYEPVFVQKTGAMPSLTDKLLHKIITGLKSFCLNLANRKGIKDENLVITMNKIYEDAKNNGWYISPKEVPFYEAELNNYLENDYTVRKRYIVNKTDFDIAQSLVINKIYKPGFLFSNVLIPFASWLDKLSFKGNYTFYIAPQTHLFTCFELVRK